MTHPPSINDDRNPVDVLADEYAARLRKGESPSMAEYVAKYPEHAGQIEELFPGVELLEQLSQKQESEASYTQKPRQDRLPVGHRFGDIEIVREVGRGGMGVVYEAYQHSLNRSVAVKAIGGASLLSSNQVARFQREAQAAAQLHHTNIVPVFGVGEQDGISYYVMQLIHGLGLDAILGELARKTHHRPPAPASADHPDLSINARELADVLVSGQLSESAIRAASGGGSTLRPSAVNTTPVNSSRSNTPPTNVTPSVDNSPTVLYTPGLTDADAEADGETAENRAEDRTGDIAAAETPSVRSSRELKDELQDSLQDNADSAGSSATDGLSPFVRSSLVLKDDIPAETFSPSTPETNATPDIVADPTLTSLGSRYWRNIARIGLQVASGLQYAHSQGTLHRDIKPANILLDSDGIAWIADFGLAKLLEQEDVTKTGDVVGTLRYMAPEQFRGQTDGRSDLYALGLTLYELLTLRPAYDDTDRQHLIAKKLTPHDPPQPRKLNPSLPRDLETIVLKCLAWEPDGRYATAGALVDDLQAFLEDRPIKARPISPVERFWRWCKRNPAVASLSTTVLALLLLAAGLASMGYVRAQRLRKKAEEGQLAAIDSAIEAKNEKEKAERARADTERIVDLQWQALDTIYSTFVPDRFAGPVEASTEDETELETASSPAVLSPQTAEMLEKMLAAFDQIAAIRGENARNLGETAKAYRKVGDLHLRLGQNEEAAVAFQEAIDRYRKLQELKGVETDTAVQIARLHNGLGLATRDGSESRRILEQSLVILIQTQVDQTDPAVRQATASTHYLLGRRMPFGFGGGPSRGPTGGPGHRPEGLRQEGHRSGERGPDRGGRGGRSERGSRGRPPEPGPPESGPPESGPPEPGRLTEGRPRFEPDGRGGGRWAGFERHRNENRQHLQSAADILLSLTAEFPGQPEYQFLRALCHLELSHPWMLPEGQPKSEGLADAITLLEDLVAKHPKEPDYLYQLSEAYEQRYFRWKQTGRFLIVPSRRTGENGPDLSQLDAAQGDLQQAIALTGKLMRLQPNVSRYAMSHVWLKMHLADLLAFQKEPEAAVTVLKEAAELRVSIRERFPSEPGYLDVRSFFADVLMTHVLMGSGDHTAAIRLLRPRIEALEAMSEQTGQPGPRIPGDIRRSLYETFAKLLTATGDVSAAAKAKEQADRIPSRGSHHPSHPEPPTGPPPSN